jgi:hypothetical protein
VLEYTGNLGKDRQLTAHQRGSTDGDQGSSTESDAIINTQTKVAEKDTKEEITLLDTLKVERERGITVKASAASMLYRHPSATNEDGLILLNMVDTPGKKYRYDLLQGSNLMTSCTFKTWFSCLTSFYFLLLLFLRQATQTLVWRSPNHSTVLRVQFCCLMQFKVFKLKH